MDLRWAPHVRGTWVYSSENLSQNIDPSENPPHARGTSKGRWGHVKMSGNVC